MKKLLYFLLLSTVLGFMFLNCEKTTNPVEVQLLNEEPSLRLEKKSGKKNFSENFQHDLSKWTGNRWMPRDYSAIIVDDPLRPGNKVVTFTNLVWGGDIYGSDDVALVVEPGNTCVLTFEYLGIPGMGGVPDDLGGSIGATVLDENGPAGGMFFACTCDWPIGCKEDILIDDGQWHKYTVEFNPFCPEFYYGDPESINKVVVMAQDFSESFGVAGDVFFDKIKLKVKK